MFWLERVSLLQKEKKNLSCFLIVHLHFIILCSIFSSTWSVHWRVALYINSDWFFPSGCLVALIPFVDFIFDLLLLTHVPLRRGRQDSGHAWTLLGLPLSTLSVFTFCCCCWRVHSMERVFLSTSSASVFMVLSSFPPVQEQFQMG